MALALLTPPASKAVTLDQVKEHLRVETNDDDSYLDQLIDASTAYLETVSGIRLNTQSWRQYLDCADLNAAIVLDVFPVQSVTGMRIYDRNGDHREIALSVMELDSVSNPARLLIDDDLHSQRRMNGIEIDIVAGYAETGVDVPDSLKRALLLLIAHAYEFRGAVPIGQQPASEPHGFRTLIAPFRRVRL